MKSDSSPQSVGETRTYSGEAEALAHSDENELRAQQRELGAFLGAPLLRRSVPPTARPEAIAQSAEPEAIAQSAESESIPQSAEPESIAQSAEPESIPQSAEPESIPQSAEPESIPQSAEPESIAQSAEPESIRQSAEPESIRQSADAEALAQETFDDEEHRFFSEPPDPYEETTQPSLENEASLDSAPALTDSSGLDPQLEEFVGRAPPSARQKQLRRRVAASLCVMLSLLLVGLAARKGIETGGKWRPFGSAKAASSLPALAALKTDGPAEVPPPPADSDLNEGMDEDTLALIRAARALLTAGRIREGVAAARQALAKNPLEAEPYILLAAGLQDQGAWNEARNVFEECLHKSKRGEISLCQYFARR